MKAKKIEKLFNNQFHPKKMISDFKEWSTGERVQILSDINEIKQKLKGRLKRKERTETNASLRTLEERLITDSPSTIDRLTIDSWLLEIKIFERDYSKADKNDDRNATIEKLNRIAKEKGYIVVTNGTKNFRFVQDYGTYLVEQLYQIPESFTKKTTNNIDKQITNAKEAEDLGYLEHDAKVRIVSCLKIYRDNHNQDANLTHVKAEIKEQISLPEKKEVFLLT